MNTLNKKSSLKKLLPYAALLVCAVAAPLLFSSGYWMSVFMLVLYQVLGSTSLRVIKLSGNLTFAHGSFIALGAYFSGILGKTLGINPVITILLGGLFAALVSILTGIPFVRLKGMYYSMASMFMGVTFIYVIQAMKITGGYRGLTGVPSLVKNTTAAYYIFLAFTVLCLLVMYRFEFSRIGTTLRAVAQSEDVAASIGVNVTFYRLLAIAVGSFFAGLAGAAYGSYLTVLSPTNYGMTFSLWLLMYMMIGGEDKFIGPIIGAIIFTLIPEFGRKLSSSAPYLTAVCMLLIAYLLPGGLAGIPDIVRARRARRKEALPETAAEAAEERGD